MKFLEVTTIDDSTLLIETSKIISIEKLKVTTETYCAIAYLVGRAIITEKEYNRITQTIDKVDHL